MSNVCRNTRIVANPLAACERGRQDRQCRGAFAVIAVIVMFVIAVTLIGVWTQAAVRQRLQIESRQIRLQAAELAESGVRRAAARRAGEPEYAGETWSLPAGTIGNGQVASVRIKLTPTADGRVVIEAVAEYPAGAVRRARSLLRWSSCWS
jgi:hypothetical protein